MYLVTKKKELMDCVKCGNEIPPKRLEILPGTKTCVNCSTESAKRGVPIMKGKGDHTWVDLEIMDQEQYEIYQELNNPKKKPQGFDKIED
tara:strand:- start:248 stop:517 length:270 start_codon:yes stop_codon:yes gene_type:complete